MKTIATRGAAQTPHMEKRVYNIVYTAPKNKITGYFDYTPQWCEFCGRRITGHDRLEAPYADGRYLCAVCRVEYMDLHHADPFRVMTTCQTPEEETA